MKGTKEMAHHAYWGAISFPKPTKTPNNRHVVMQGKKWDLSATVQKWKTETVQK
jgi:hypothetical protein